MEIKKIVEGMTAPQVAKVIEDNFNEAEKTKADKTELSELGTKIKNIPKTEIVNNLSDGGANKALSAEMGKLVDKKIMARPYAENSNDGDLLFSDDDGNVILAIKEGHVKTKRFDSSNIKYDNAEESSNSLSNKSWCSLGTSITWYNNNLNGMFQQGYQGWLMDKVSIGSLINKGVNGGTIVNLANNANTIIPTADIYTIEHGVNDWGMKTLVGDMNDYIGNTGVSTFYGAYKIIIDKIYSLNRQAIVVLCTPRKARGFNGYLPDSCNGNIDGIKLKDYADAVVSIANYEGLPICDWFNLCGVNDHNIDLYSIDDALHPNDLGYKQMAQLLIKEFNNIY